mmetsp:Transcript_42545/g.76388  ORF Transcript_42545/g.76388 Transcript_42545/m.76388 type:complete len:236 (-) Transcript_42545:1739-2446(-)
MVCAGHDGEQHLWVPPLRHLGDQWVHVVDRVQQVEVGDGHRPFHDGEQPIVRQFQAFVLFVPFRGAGLDGEVLIELLLLLVFLLLLPVRPRMVCRLGPGVQVHTMPHAVHQQRLAFHQHTICDVIKVLQSRQVLVISDRAHRGQQQSLRHGCRGVRDNHTLPAVGVPHDGAARVRLWVGSKIPRVAKTQQRSPPSCLEGQLGNHCPTLDVQQPERGLPSRVEDGKGDCWDALEEV